MEQDRLWEIIEEESAVLQQRLVEHQEQAGRYAAEMDKPDFPDDPDDDFLVECLARFEAQQPVNTDKAEKAINHLKKLANDDPMHARHINMRMKRRAGEAKLFDGRVFFKLILRKPEWPDKKMTAAFCPFAVVDGMVRHVRNSGYEVQGAMSIYVQGNNGQRISGTEQMKMDGSPDERPFVMEQEVDFPGTMHIKIQGMMGAPGSYQKEFLHTDQSMVITPEDLEAPLKRKPRRAPRHSAV